MTDASFLYFSFYIFYYDHITFLMRKNHNYLEQKTKYSYLSHTGLCSNSASTLRSYIALGKLFNLSKPQFARL